MFQTFDANTSNDFRMDFIVIEHCILIHFRQNIYKKKKEIERGSQLSTHKANLILAKKCRFFERIENGEMETENYN